MYHRFSSSNQPLREVSEFIYSHGINSWAAFSALLGVYSFFGKYGCDLSYVYQDCLPDFDYDPLWLVFSKFVLMPFHLMDSFLRNTFKFLIVDLLRGGLISDYKLYSFSAFLLFGIVPVVCGLRGFLEIRKGVIQYKSLSSYLAGVGIFTGYLVAAGYAPGIGFSMLPDEIFKTLSLLFLWFEPT